MRPALLTASLSLLALAGCQSVPLTDLKTVPHATLVSSHVDVNPERTDLFRTLAIDGRDTIDPTDITIRNAEIDHSELVAAGHGAHVTIDALAWYSNAARRLFWDPMRVKGTIDFVPAADATYVVRGKLTPELYSVWIENGATHEVVGSKLSVPGHGAAAAAAEAEAASAAAAAQQ